MGYFDLLLVSSTILVCVLSYFCLHYIRACVGASARERNNMIYFPWVTFLEAEHFARFVTHRAALNLNWFAMKGIVLLAVVAGLFSGFARLHPLCMCMQNLSLRQPRYFQTFDNCST